MGRSRTNAKTTHKTETNLDYERPASTTQTVARAMTVTTRRRSMAKQTSAEDEDSKYSSTVSDDSEVGDALMGSDEEVTSESSDDEEEWDSGDIAKVYFDYCGVYNYPVDYAVVAALESQFHLLSLTNVDQPGVVFPALQTLLDFAGPCNFIKTLRIEYPTQVFGKTAKRGAFADIDVKLLCELFCSDDCAIEELDIQRIRISDEGLNELGSLVRNTRCLKRLNIAHSNLGVTCSDKALFQFAKSLAANHSLVHLNVSNNWLGYDVSNALGRSMWVVPDTDNENLKIMDGVVESEVHQTAITDSDLPLLKAMRRRNSGISVVNFGNDVFEEVLNALTHGIGALLAFVGAIVLLHEARGDSRKFWSSAVYCFTTVGLFTSSATFHAMFLDKRTFEVLRVLDHSAIYFMIAGSYMPFCLVDLAESPAGVIIAFIEWGCVALGVVIALIDHRYPLKFKTAIELVLYITMGYMAFFHWDAMVTHVDPNALELLLYGGYAFTFGILFFLMERIHPISHSIWHIFVLIGAGFHYFSILHYVVGIDQALVTNSTLAKIPLGECRGL